MSGHIQAVVPVFKALLVGPTLLTENVMINKAMLGKPSKDGADDRKSAHAQM